MRLRNIKGAQEIIQKSEWVLHDPVAAKGHWIDIFGSENPIHIEVGMGKGQFIIEMAQAHPEVNFIGIEMYDSVLLRAVQNADSVKEELQNIRFIRMDAGDLPEVFEKGEVDKIYLNFSDPWPKERHAKRRLTSRQFLDRYRRILLPGCFVEFKTDNKALFEFSLQEIEESRWILDACTCDLHHDDSMNQDNIMTEYEEKFSSMGKPIFKLIMHYKCF